MTNEPYKSLSSISAVQARPGMYIGSVENPNQLATEVIDNMLDEVANGHANYCRVSFVNNDTCWISDNGRGLAVYNMQLSDGSIEDSVIALCTVTHTGSKFDTNDYNTLIGMHGVGLVAVNALSKWLVIQTRDRQNRKKVHKYIFANAELYSKEEFELEDDGTWNTIIGFQSDDQYFDENIFNQDEIKNRLELAQAKFSNATFIVNDQQLPNKSFEQYAREILEISNDVALHRIDYSNKQNEKITLFITYTHDLDQKFLGDVNLRLCTGTYQTNLQTLLKKLIESKIDKKYKNVNQNLYLLGCKLFASITVPEPQFDSQTKTRMTLNVKDSLIEPLSTQLKRFLSEEDIFNCIKNNVESKLFTKSSKKQSKKKDVSVNNKVRDCAHIPGEYLYLVEGESALGPLKQIRDIRTEGLFPLKGKVLNVETASLEKIKNNTEIQYLLEALGPKDNRRYDKIRILCDADSVSAETTIYYIDKDGFIQYDQIQNLQNIENAYVSSYNEQTGKRELKNIKRVISHNYDKDYIYRVKTLGSHVEDFTDDHVLYVYDSSHQSVKQKAPSEIDIKNDYLVIPKNQLTVDKNNIELNISNEIFNIINLNSSVYISVHISEFQWDTKYAKIDISNRIQKINKLSQKTKIPYPTLHMYDKGIDNTHAPINRVYEILNHTDIDFSDTYVRIELREDTLHYIKKGKLVSKQQGNIRSNITIDENIAYLIGQYIGDGSHGSSKNNPYEIHFNVGDGRYNNHLYEAFKELGYNNYVIDKKLETNSEIIRLKSIEFCAILKKLGLTKDYINRYKFIPTMFFSCSENIRMNLLKGLFHSDGSLLLDKNRYKFSYSTNSNQLKQDISFLFRQFGITPIVINRQPVKSGLNHKGKRIIASKNSYNIIINKRNDLNRILTIFDLNHSIHKLRENNSSIFNINNDFSAIKIRSLEKVPYNYNIVYDLEVEDNNNFSIGETGTVVHNSDGYHITVLLLLFLQKFADDYIKNGKVSIVLPPLYGAIKGKTYIPIYDHSETEQYRQQNYKILRFKGLAEMSSEKLKKTINDGLEYIVQWPNKEERDALVKIITDTELKQRVMKDENANFAKVLEKAKKQQLNSN